MDWVVNSGTQGAVKLLGEEQLEQETFSLRRGSWVGI